MKENIQIDSSNRIVAGELKSNQMLTQDIAHSTLQQLTKSTLKPAARKTKDGWMAIIEDFGGRIHLWGVNYRTELEALSAAKISYAYLK